MNKGKTLFAQVMEFVPWKNFSRIVERHNGDSGVRTLSCANIFRVMAFAQLTWRESLRDIEVCLTSNREKLFHMGIKSIPYRSTLSDALNSMGASFSSKAWRLLVSKVSIIQFMRRDCNRVISSLNCFMLQLPYSLAFARLVNGRSGPHFCRPKGLN